MTKAVLINEEKGDVIDIELDIDPVKNEIFKLLGGAATFIGQWPELEEVIVKCTKGGIKNMNNIPPPFENDVVFGKILLIRMDKYSEPKDFTLGEYNHFIRERLLE